MVSWLPRETLSNIFSPHKRTGDRDICVQIYFFAPNFLKGVTLCPQIFYQFSCTVFGEVKAYKKNGAILGPLCLIA